MSCMTLGEKGRKENHFTPKGEHHHASGLFLNRRRGKEWVGFSTTIEEREKKPGKGDFDTADRNKGKKEKRGESSLWPGHGGGGEKEKERE